MIYLWRTAKKSSKTENRWILVLFGQSDCNTPLRICLVLENRAACFLLSPMERPQGTKYQSILSPFPSGGRIRTNWLFFRNVCRPRSVINAQLYRDCHWLLRTYSCYVFALSINNYESLISFFSLSEFFMSFFFFFFLDDQDVREPTKIMVLI